jgi:hypothetical protein
LDGQSPSLFICAASLLFIHHDDHDVLALRAVEASPLFAKSDAMGKRMTRIERIRTDFDSPSVRPFPPAAEKIRFYPWHPWHPFCHPAALADLNQV